MRNSSGGLPRPESDAGSLVVDTVVVDDPHQVGQLPACSTAALPRRIRFALHGYERKDLALRLEACHDLDELRADPRVKIVNLNDYGGHARFADD